MQKDLQFWVALNKAGLGPASFEKLLDYYKTAEKAWLAFESDLRRIGLDKRALPGFLEKRSKINPEKELSKIQKLGIKILTIKDKKYPKALAEIPKPPPVLFYKGELKKEDESAFAVVGTRRLTPYGKRVCEKITYGLAKNGLTVVSGLALGIDSVAHKTALEAGARTIAVLGTSLDFIYPQTNKNLAEKIVQNGAVISEFPLGTQGFPGNFPQRNRIISGLSLGTLVIEAAARSGSLITARFALEQNREVFTIPGSIYSSQSEGCNNLIKMGARAVTDYDDILDELSLKDKWKGGKKEKVSFENKDEERIWKVLDSDRAVHIDRIAEKSGLAIFEVSSVLTLMEMKGMVKNLGAQNYVRK